MEGAAGVATGDLEAEAIEVGDTVLVTEAAGVRVIDCEMEAAGEEEAGGVLDPEGVIDAAEVREIELVAVWVEEALAERDRLLDAVWPGILEGAGVSVTV